MIAVPFTLRSKMPLVPENQKQQTLVFLQHQMQLTETSACRAWRTTPRKQSQCLVCPLRATVETWLPLHRLI